MDGGGGGGDSRSVVVVGVGSVAGVDMCGGSCRKRRCGLGEEELSSSLMRW